MKIVYFNIYGHSGNRTAAMIPNNITGRSQVFGYDESNLNEANFD